MSKLVTPPFRGSFVHLFEPSLPKGAEDESKAKYQITAALDADDPFVAKLEKLIEDTAKAKFGPKVVFGHKKGQLRSPIKDDSEYAEHEGKVTFQMSTRRRPEVVDSSMQPIISADEVYSGAWYRASFTAYAWDHPTGGKGVSLSLSNVLKVKDDEAFDGRTSADSDFADFAEVADLLG